MRAAVAARGGKLVCPSYVTQGFLTEGECWQSIGVSRVRVLVENVNERYHAGHICFLTLCRLKHFRILTMALPSQLFPFFDDIVACCAFLTSFMGPLRQRVLPPTPQLPSGAARDPVSALADAGTHGDVGATDSEDANSDADSEVESGSSSVSPLHSDDEQGPFAWIEQDVSSNDENDESTSE